MDEIRPAFSDVTNGGAVFSSTVVRSAGPSVGSTIDALDNSLVSAGQNKQLATPWYSDQVLPFDITLSGANEYGAMCAAKIFGVEILNEGWGISIDDAVSEMQATFVARVVEPMSAVASPFHKYDQVIPSCRQQEHPRAGMRSRAFSTPLPLHITDCTSLPVSLFA